MYIYSLDFNSPKLILISSDPHTYSLFPVKCSQLSVPYLLFIFPDTFSLLDSQALTLEYVRKNHRLQQLNNTAATLVRAQMENARIPSLLNLQESCRILDIQNLVLLEAKCIFGTTYDE